MKPTPKRRGEWVESLFLARANHHGLVVSKPWGDSARYDFVIEGGHRKGSSRLLRVQVKSTSARLRTGYSCHLSGPRGDKPYSAAQIDYFAIYVVPERLWYILPISVVPAGKSVYLSPRGPGRINRYLEAWSLLGRPLDALAEPRPIP